MRITDVRVTPVIGKDKLKAFVTLTINDCFVVRDIKLLQGPGGFIVAMPSKKLKDGSYQDVAHPINKGAREMIERAVLTEYKKVAGAAA